MQHLGRHGDEDVGDLADRVKKIDDPTQRERPKVCVYRNRGELTLARGGEASMDRADARCRIEERVHRESHDDIERLDLVRSGIIDPVVIGPPLGEEGIDQPPWLRYNGTRR